MYKRQLQNAAAATEEERRRAARRFKDAEEAVTRSDNIKAGFCLLYTSQTAAPEQPRFDPAAVSPDAQQVYAALKPTPQGIDALCAATRLPAGRVLAANLCFPS